MGDESAEYLRGFVHGMHFILLALDGRLTHKQLTPADVRRVLAEYYAMVADQRAGLLAAAPAQLFGDEAPVR
jgi:hypothetical protein